MAIKTVITDEENNELHCYLNENGKVSIEVAPEGEEQFIGFIEIEKEDVQNLIKLLTELESHMGE